VGTATIRIRLKWKEEIDLMSQNLIDAPRYHVNVESEKEFKIIRYLCKGEVSAKVDILSWISFQIEELIYLFTSLLFFRLTCKIQA